jgi:hypothetical protein
MDPKARSAELAEDEIDIRFEDSDTSSEDVLAAARKRGLDLGLTATQLDDLRRLGPKLRKWLSENPSRHGEFKRDPRAALAGLGWRHPKDVRERDRGGTKPHLRRR